MERTLCFALDECKCTFWTRPSCSESRLSLLSGCRGTVRWTAWRRIIWQWYLWSRCSRSLPWTRAWCNLPESWSCSTCRSSRWAWAHARTHCNTSHCVIDCVIWRRVQNHVETDGEIITALWRAPRFSWSLVKEWVQQQDGRQCIKLYCSSELDNTFV